MTQAIPARLNEALSQLLQIEWRFEDDATGSTDQDGGPDHDSQAEVSPSASAVQDGEPNRDAAVSDEASDWITREFGSGAEGREDEEDEHPDSTVIQDLDWQQYRLGLIDVKYHRELSDAEESYEKSRWLRAQLMRRHLDEFRQLTDAALRFFLELTEAGGQCILGERARLPVLKRSEQPHSRIQFDHVNPPDPPPLSIDEYEQKVGGPHVLGARLLWWCAAAVAPTRFGYSRPFSQALWCQPIWVTDDSRGTRSNDRPITLMKQAASKVCRLLEKAPDNVATDQEKRETPENGPQEPNRFWWNGSLAEFQRTPWLLLKCVWDRPTEGTPGNLMKKVDESTALDEVWSGAQKSESTLSRTVNRVNNHLEKFPFTLRRKSGYFVLDIHETQPAIDLHKTGVQ